MEAGEEDGTIFRYELILNVELKAEILRYGAGVEVLDPRELREALYQEAELLYKRYRTK